MKLRNKKTGERGDYQVISAGHLIRVRDLASDESWQYDCLESFNDKWEDYIPVEPLIKDLQIRKAVRAWAEATRINPTNITISKGTDTTSLIGWNSGRIGGISIDFRTFMLEELEDAKDCTLAELCGEEEE